MIRSLTLPLVVFMLLAAPSAASALTQPQVSAGADHTCAVSDTGVVSCWGRNDDGQLGDGTTTQRLTPVKVIGLPEIRTVAAGNGSTCALATNGTVWCWGANDKGQLGNGTTSAVGADHPTPSQLTALGATATQVTGGTTNFCARLNNSEAWCWGGNDYGEMGTLLASNPQPTPIKVNLAGQVTRVSAGYTHACAVLTSAQVACWGYNASGMLGDGTYSARPEPVFAIGVSATEVYAGGYTSCAVYLSGPLTCWGGGGIVGNPPSGNSPTPVFVTLESGGIPDYVRGIGGSNSNNCALANGKTYCWGGSLSNGSPSSVVAPTVMPLPSGTVSLSANGFAPHNCAVLADGSVLCWGYNADGQLGNGSTSTTTSNTPSVVTGLDLIQGQYIPESTALEIVGAAKLDKKRTTYTLTGVLRIGINRLLKAPEVCVGAVSFRVKYSYRKYRRVRGKRKRVTVDATAKGTAQLAATNDFCSAQGSVKLPVKYLNGKKVTLSADFAGNASIPAVSSRVEYRLKKVTAKKKSKKKRKKK